MRLQLGLTAVLQTALSQQPGNRYATAAEMVDALAELATDRPSSTTQRNIASSPSPPRSVPQADRLPSFLQPESEAIEVPVFVSRQSELARLRDYLDKAIAGQG